MTNLQRFSRLLLVAVLFVTTVGCGVTNVYVEKPTSMSLLETIETDAILGARVEAHNVAAMVRGDAPTKLTKYLEPKHLPEAYTLDGSEGLRRWQYDLAYAATRLIRAHFNDTYRDALRIESDKLADITNAAGGTSDDIYQPNREWPIELANIEKRFVFEIVPPGDEHQAYGKKKAELHVMLLNGTLFKKPQFKLGTGFSGEIGVRFEENAAPWKLSWSTTQPGVVQYHWQAMTVAKVTEESCRNAYLAKQWHDVTPREMALHGRSLHVVVEKLVQAREKMGPTRAAIKMPVVPGKSLFDYLDTVAKWSAHDEQRAQLLPVMYGPPVEVVPAKQFVGQTVEEEELYGEGVYDLKGVPGKQPWNLHMGNSAHRLIGNYYKIWHPGRVYTNWTSIATIIKEITNSEPALTRSEALLRPDIADLSSERLVFEIKSRAPGRLAEGQTAVNKYLALLNKSLPPKQQFSLGTGFGHSFLVRFDQEMPWWRIEWSTVSPGVIQYRWQELQGDEVDEPKVMAGVAAGKYVWIDLTESQMKKYGQAVDSWSRTYVGGRQILYKTQSVTGVVVEAIGHTAMTYMSPGLSAKPNVAPKTATLPVQTTPKVQTGRVRVETLPPPKTRVSPGATPEPDVEPEFAPNVAPGAKKWQ